MHIPTAVTAGFLAAIGALVAVPGSAGPVITPPASIVATATAEPVPRLEWEVVSRRPHDSTAFTQGLQLDEAGRLFESTGLRGRSTLREVDAQSGVVLRVREQPDAQFSEGLALVGDELVQLTWTAGLARRYEVETFALTGVDTYEGEGWGLCYDGGRLVMSDGSDRLTFRDASTFEVTGSVPVTLADEPLSLLNELECVDGGVWANVWHTDTIVRIDPSDGRVTGLLDLTGIIDPDPTEDGLQPEAVLNGIAYDAAADTYLVTGKLWPELIEIRVSEPATTAQP